MKRIFLIIIACMFFGLSFGQNSASLKMNLEKNRTYRLRSVSEQTIVQTVNGNQQTIETASDYTISVKMVDATPAFIVTEVRFDTLSTKTNTMGKTDITSSAAAGSLQAETSSGIMSYFMNRMTKNPLYAKLDFTGKVIEIVNAKMVSDMILKDTSSISLAEPAASALKLQVNNMVNENAFKTIIELFTFCLPGKTVAAGESWSYTNSSDAGGMLLDITTTFKLDGISGNKASVTSESNIRTSPNAKPMESGGAKITYDDLKGMNKAAIIIDINTGLVIENTSKTRLAGILGVSVAGMNMQIPMEVNGESKITLVQ